MEEVKNNDWVKGSYDNVVFNMFSIIEDIATNDKKINEGDYLILANAFKRLNELRSELKNNNHYQSIENNRLRQVERVRNGLQEFRIANRINSNLKISCDKCNSTFANKYILNKHKKNAKKCLEINSNIIFKVSTNTINDNTYYNKINGNNVINKNKLLLKVVENNEELNINSYNYNNELITLQKQFIKNMVIVMEQLKHLQKINKYKHLNLIIGHNYNKYQKIYKGGNCIYWIIKD
jgi:hypothetical protein